MPHDLRSYLFDIQDAIAHIEEFVKGSEFADYKRNPMMRAAVERMFMIIGEAMAQIEHRFPGSRQRIEGARKIVDFRNVLAHEYRQIDDSLVWSIVRGPLLRLKEQVNEWDKEASS